MIVDAADADKAATILREQGETVYSIGVIQALPEGEEPTIVV